MSLFMIQRPKLCLTVISLYTPNGILSLLSVLFGSTLCDKSPGMDKAHKRKKG